MAPRKRGTDDAGRGGGREAVLKDDTPAEPAAAGAGSNLAPSLSFTSAWSLCILALSGVCFVLFLEVGKGNDGSTEKCDLPHLNMHQAARRFASDFRGQRPVILQGAALDWPVMNWSLGTWQQALRGVELPVRRTHAATVSGGSGSSDFVEASDFFGSQSLQKDSMIFHTERSNSNVPQLLQSLQESGDIRGIPALSSVSLSPVLSIGGKDAGLGYHQHDEAWLALVHGEKSWFLRPPHNPGNTFYRRVAADALQHEPGFIRCLQAAGDILYFPAGWWHATYNVPDGNEGVTIGIGGQGGIDGLKGLVHLNDLEALKQQAAGDSRSSLEALAEEAGRAGHVPILKWLHGQGVKSRSIHPASFTGHAETVSWLLGLKGSLHERDDNGHSPLDVVAHRGHVSVLKSLIDHRVRVDRADGSVGAALGAAALSGHVLVLKHLVQSGATLETAAGDGSPAIKNAVEAGHLEVLQYMLDKGVSAVAPFDTHGTSPLLLAALRGHPELISSIISKHGSSVADFDLLAYLATSAGHTAVLDLAAQHIGAAAVIAAAQKRQAEPSDAGHEAVRRWLQAKSSPG